MATFWHRTGDTAGSRHQHHDDATGSNAAGDINRSGHAAGCGACSACDPGTGYARSGYSGPGYTAITEYA